MSIVFWFFEHKIVRNRSKETKASHLALWVYRPTEFINTSIDDVLIAHMHGQDEDLGKVLRKVIREELRKMG